ncbi:MAG: transposon-encoded TnpW family protein [Clostridia bacterium]|nr:transposon-encoded TnpW family protein [Clostridia bacterium]
MLIYIQQKSQSPIYITRRIGGTNYRVRAYVQPEEKENMESRLLRMIQNKMDFTNNGPNTSFQKGLSCGTMNVPQMSCPA